MRFFYLEGVLLLIKGMREWSGRMASFIEANGGYYLDSFVKQPCASPVSSFFPLRILLY